MFDLTGRVAVVTGGNRGIGRAIALGLARAGASVAILARDQAANAEVLAELTALGGRALALPLDVTQRPALAPALEEVERRLGGVDILVNNAGVVAVGAGAVQEPVHVWDHVIAANLHGPYLLSKLAAASMIKRRRGKIINISSIYGQFGGAAVPSYSAAKGALVQLTKSMAIELAPHNIQVNAIAPGWIATDMTAMIRDIPDWTGFNNMILARTPAGRWGEAADTAGAAVFLASAAADFITGATLPVDGGYSIN